MCCSPLIQNYSNFITEDSEDDQTHLALGQSTFFLFLEMFAKRIHSKIFPETEVRLTVPQFSGPSFWLRCNICISLFTRDPSQAPQHFTPIHKYTDFAEILWKEKFINFFCMMCTAIQCCLLSYKMHFWKCFCSVGIEVKTHKKVAIRYPLIFNKMLLKILR